jgi:DNA-binding HxlR family transcriptional regulator
LDPPDRRSGVFRRRGPGRLSQSPEVDSVAAKRKPAAADVALREGVRWLSDSELEELENRFRAFAKESAQFREDIVHRTGMTLKDGPSAAAQANLEIARTVFSKWSLDTMVALYAQRVAGFAELRRLLSGISARVLSQRLKALEELGFVERSVIGDRPPRVVYVLTHEGHTVSRLGEPIFLYLRAHRAYGRRIPRSKPEPVAAGSIAASARRTGR